MISEVTKLVRPSLRCVRVAFFPNLARRSNLKAIPFGVFCEVKTARVHGLALKARALLSENELEAIALVFRKHLANPFAYFSAEFDSAWSASGGAGSALDFLAQKHTAALSVLEPYHPAEADRHSWWRALFGEPETNGFLKKVVYEEFDRLLAELPPWDGPTPPPVLRVQLAEAAAA
jgi:hypothetical protein